MAMWLYQMNQDNWTPERYRLEIWENEKWVRRVYKIFKQGNEIERGDTVIFFYTPSSGDEAGFYGWGIILEWDEDVGYLYFRSVSPTNYLKMIPWWDDKAKKIADKIRGKMKQGTLWYIPNELAKELKVGIHEWITSNIDKI